MNQGLLSTQLATIEQVIRRPVGQGVGEVKPILDERTGQYLPGREQESKCV